MRQVVGDVQIQGFRIVSILPSTFRLSIVLHSLSPILTHINSIIEPTQSKQHTMDVNISVDLNKALEPSLNVASAAAVPGIYANLTTNALQWEPGEFSNGVNKWGSNNVFILHNSGSAQGANQRYAYLGIATTKPFNLKQVQLNIDTNAGGSSEQNPVSVAVEISPRDDFSTVTPLGTVVSHHNPQTLALNAFIPYGTTYVRLRVTSPIYDGSNYVAYSGITLAGSTIADAVVSEPGPISPTSGIGLASQETFSITYDFNRASSQGALVVAASGGATSNMVSLLASNANQWEPGEFMNGGKHSLGTPRDKLSCELMIHNSPKFRAQPQCLLPPQCRHRAVQQPAIPLRYYCYPAPAGVVSSQRPIQHQRLRLRTV